MSGTALSSAPFTLNRRPVLAWTLMFVCGILGTGIAITTYVASGGGHRYLFAAVLLIPALWIYLPATWRWTVDQRGISRGRRLIRWEEITRIDLRTFPKGFRNPGSIDLRIHTAEKRFLLRTFVEGDARELAKRLREVLPENLFPAASQRRAEEVWRRR